MISVKERIVGTWKLIGTEVKGLTTGEKSKGWGDNPEGYINYSPDGRMIVINARSGRSKPAGPVPTPEEAAELFKTMLAYAGTYTIQGDTVTHHVDISWNETWTGTDQVRTARFEGDRVHLSTAPSPDLASGKISIRTMTWEKLR